MVRTSLDPALQIAAEKAVRDGLMAYDRKMGGWRGPVGHLDGGPALAKNWAEPLAQLARPPGMLPAGSSPPCWRRPTARHGSAGWTPRRGTPQPRTGTLPLSDIAWARPIRDSKPGPAPRRMSDVMQQGDVVMVEPSALPPTTAPQGKNAKPAPPPLPRLTLRQIPAVQGALVSLDPTTGRVLAMVGGWSFEGSQFNRATPGAAPAWVQLQAVCLPDRAGEGLLAQPTLPRCADRHGHRGGPLAAEQFRDGFRRPDAAAHRAGEVAEPGDAARGAGRRHAGDRRQRDRLP